MRPYENRPRVDITTSALVMEGALYLVGACIALISLIYCYRFGLRHMATIEGPVTIGLASITNLPYGLYLGAKGIHLLSKAFSRVVWTTKTRRGECPSCDSVEPEPGAIPYAGPDFLESDAEWHKIFSGFPALDPKTRIERSLGPIWREMPYPQMLADMAVASLVFHDTANGLLPLSPGRWRSLGNAYLRQFAVLLATSGASVSLIWIGTGPWRWIPLFVLAVTMGVTVTFVWALWRMEILRLKRMGCCIPGHLRRSRRLLRKRLALLLTEPFGGPFAYLATARQCGDDATHLTSLLRPAPWLTAVFLVIPFSSWVGQIVPIMASNTPFLTSIGSAVASLLAAGFFWFSYKVALGDFSFEPFIDFPGSSWVFRSTCDAIRRLYE